jgi:hypothetical protein
MTNSYDSETIKHLVEKKRLPDKWYQEHELPVPKSKKEFVTN